MNKKKYLNNNNLILFTLWIMIFMIIHGEILFNKLSWYDDIFLVDKVNTDLDFGRVYGLSHGRFTLFFISKIVEKITAEGITSSPVEQGLVAAICTVCIGLLIIKILDIKEIIGKISIMLICISLPVIAGNLGYMITIGYNMIGALLSVGAAWLCVCYGNKVSLFLSVFLLAMAMGEYQCYFTLFIVIILCSFIKTLIVTDQSRQVLRLLLRYIFVTLAGLVLYLVINKAVLWCFHGELSDYGSINTYGIVSWEEYFNRIVLAYRDFVSPGYTRYTMFPMGKGWHIAILLILSIEIVVSLIYLIKKKAIVALVMFCVFVAFVPMLFNLNIIMYGTMPLHSLHQYQFIMIFALIVMLAELISNTMRESLRLINAKVIRCGCLFTTGFVFLIGCLYVRYDNLCYTEAEMRQTQAISYFTSLISDIHSTDGYYNEIPVCYVNEYDKRFPSDHNNYTGKNVILTNPYDDKMMRNIAMTHSWREYMYQWCNYIPASTPVISQLSEETQLAVEEMPRYPDNGSIKVIDGTLIIKF